LTPPQKNSDWNDFEYFFHLVCRIHSRRRLSVSFYQKALEHPLTGRGIRDFKRDWKATGQEG
jgi:hypothetical protein